MAQSLKFTVEVAAEQATSALKALAVASNQAGVQMRTSLASASSAAGQTSNGLMELKKSAGRARETAMFFTQALGEFGPQGRTAQLALSGVAGALMGGGGILVALGLAQAAVRMYTAASAEQAAADKAAADAARERAKEISDITAETEKITRASAGETPEMIELRQKRADVENRIADATLRRAAAAAKVEQIDTVYQGETAEYVAAKSAQDAISAELKDYLAKRAEFNKKFNAQVNAEELRAQKEKDAERLRATKESAKAEADARLAANKAADAAVLSRLREEEEIAVAEANGRAAAAAAAEAREQARVNAELARGVALGEQWGSAIGGAIGQIATGQQTAEQAMASIGQMLIKEATAAAITMAIEGGKSQAGVPVIGPVLAISAMGALLSAAMGYIGSMPSAEGGWWDTGSYEGLAMIHQNEMILPAREAEMVRRGAGGGITLNVAAYDARGFDRVLSNNSSSLSRELRRMQRKGSM